MRYPYRILDNINYLTNPRRQSSKLAVARGENEPGEIPPGLMDRTFVGDDQKRPLRLPVLTSTSKRLKAGLEPVAGIKLMVSAQGAQKFGIRMDQNHG
jgi:hypothetical protein